MNRPDQHPVNINPDRETADADPMQARSGSLEETEDAAAYANRTEQRDTTSLRPEGADRGGSDAISARERGAEEAGGERREDDGPDDRITYTPAANPLA